MKSKRCPSCRGPMTATEHAQYEYKECGLDNVVLEGGVRTYVCPSCGEQIVSIPAVEKLHKAIASAVVAKHSRLSGAEVKFLRKFLGHSNRDFARIMGVTPETSSRWASGEQPINAQADRLLRLLVWRGERVQDYDEQLRSIDDAIDESPARLEIRNRANGWEPLRSAG